MKNIKKDKLTERETEIVLYIIKGKSKTEIANILHISVSTVKTHVEKIYNKFGVHNKVELVVYVIKNNILEPLQYDKKLIPINR